MSVNVIVNSELNADHKITLAWMNEHESPIVRKGDTTVFVAIGENLIKVESDFTNMDDAEALIKVTEMLIEHYNQTVK